MISRTFYTTRRRRVSNYCPPPPRFCSDCCVTPSARRERLLICTRQTSRRRRVYTVVDKTVPFCEVFHCRHTRARAHAHAGKYYFALYERRTYNIITHVYCTRCEHNAGGADDIRRKTRRQTVSRRRRSGKIKYTLLLYSRPPLPARSPTRRGKQCD